MKNSSKEPIDASASSVTNTPSQGNPPKPLPLATQPAGIGKMPTKERETEPQSTQPQTAQPLGALASHAGSNGMPLIIQVKPDGSRTLVPVQTAVLNRTPHQVQESLLKMYAISKMEINDDLFGKVSCGSIANYALGQKLHRLEKSADGSPMTQVEYLMKKFGEHDRTVRDWRYAAKIWQRWGPSLLIPFSHYSQLLALMWVEEEEQPNVWNAIVKKTGRVPREEEIYKVAEGMDVLAKIKPVEKQPTKKIDSGAALAAIIVTIKAAVEEIRGLSYAKRSDPDWIRMAQIAQKLEESVSSGGLVKAALGSRSSTQAAGVAKTGAPAATEASTKPTPAAPPKAPASAPKAQTQAPTGVKSATTQELAPTAKPAAVTVPTSAASSALKAPNRG